MILFLTVFHIIVSILLIVFVLIHFGKGAEAGLFSSGEGAIFTSSQSGNILTKITTVLAVLFLTLSITLTALKSKVSEKSSLDGVVQEAAPVLDPENTPSAEEKKE